MNVHHALAFSIALQSVAFGHVQGFATHVPQTGQLTQLCLQQVHESLLPDFEPIGLSVDEAPGSDPAITMWSRKSLLVIRLSAVEPTIKSTVLAALSGEGPLGASLTHWNGAAPVVELFAGSTGAVRAMDLASGEVVESQVRFSSRGQSAESVGVASGLGVLRTEVGWVRAQRVTDPTADTSAIVLSGPRLAQQGGDPPLSAPSLATEKVPPRRIDRILHVRGGVKDEALVIEAAFPFTVVEFTLDGIEKWRVSPAPDELRDRLGETDLRYVIATPAIKVGHAVLNTFMALRSGRRVSALWLPNAASPRYREIPGDLSILGAFPSHRLLVATRSGRPYRLILFRWRWTDQSQSCTHAPT